MLDFTILNPLDMHMYTYILSLQVFIHFAGQQTDEAAELVADQPAEEPTSPPLPDIVSSASVAMSMLQSVEEGVH